MLITPKDTATFVNPNFKLTLNQDLENMLRNMYGLKHHHDEGIEALKYQTVTTWEMETE